MSILDLAVEIVQDLALTNESGCTLLSLAEWYGSRDRDGVDMIRHCLVVLSDCGVLERRESWARPGSYEYRVKPGAVRVNDGEKRVRVDLLRDTRNAITGADWTKQDRIPHSWAGVDGIRQRKSKRGKKK